MGRFLLAVVLLCGACAIASVHAQQADRRDLKSPEVVVETGGRMAVCDALLFTPEGRSLLAVGDDKVVRSWPCGDRGLELAGVQALRWPSWREQRGAIYALALSPDQGCRQIAIAGSGMRTGTVMVLDRATGQVLHALTDTRGNSAVIRSLAFAPSGKQIAFGTEYGGVWVWDISKNHGRRLDPPPARNEENRVRLVAFRDENTLLSVTEKGQAMQWDLPTGKGSPFLDLKVPGDRKLFRVILSPNGKWLAGGCQGPVIVLRSLDGKASHNLDLNRDDFVRSLAFDAKGERLAVGVGNANTGASFYRERDDRLLLIDLTARTPQVADGPRHTYRADALAFHPDGKRLAVAGGDNHEVTLWQLGRNEPLSVAQSAGSCLWGVALSANGRYLAFRDERDPKAPDPLHRGKGPWHVFDLERRRWTSPAGVQLTEASASEGGWTVQPDPGNPYLWRVVGPGGARPLPWEKVYDGLPRCYAFLPARGGKPVRLAVGSQWGVSIFNVTATQLRRVRLCTGHQGEVMSLAATVDKDGREWLVSASTDQTISAFALDDWPSQPELGARFSLKDGRVLVGKVDVGSPAWEAGLLEGDEVTLFAFNRNAFLYDPQQRIGPKERTQRGIQQVGTAAECLARLDKPVPDQEFYFQMKRTGQTAPVELNTRLKQRPLWRFFPTRDREWVLWMWRNYYYDTSTNGDAFIGWHVNNRDLDREPKFYKAEQFRDQFHRPDVIDKLLVTRKLTAALPKESLLPPNFDLIEPPAVRLELAAKEVKDGEVKIKLTAAPRSDNPDHQPRRVDLWINDYRFQSWQAGGQPFAREISVPAHVLRTGVNELTLQTYNQLGGRSEVSASLICRREQAAKPKLFGLIVGINDYSKSMTAPDGKRFLGNLKSARRDAEEMKASWAGQKDHLYQEANVSLSVDKEVSRDMLLKELQALASKVGPDDRLVLFLAGHGDLQTQKDGVSTFVFCCPEYDRKRFADTGLTSQALYEALAALPCRKIVFLDACRSGNLAINPIRSLTPAGRGPIILAACDPSQPSYEHEKFGHGVFTYAILEALGKQFSKADRDGDGLLNAAEIFSYIQDRMPELLKQIDREDEQHPVSFPRVLEAYPLVQK